MNNRTSYAASRILVVGLVLSVSVSFLDVALTILYRPEAMSSFAFLPLPLAVSTVVIFAVYISFWFLFFPGARRFLRVEPLASAYALAAFAGTLFLLVRLAEVSLRPNDLARLATVAGLSGAMGVGAYFTTLRLDGAARTFAHVLFRALPFLMAETMVFVWTHVYQVGSFFSVESFVLNLVYLVAVLVTIVFFRRAQSTKAVTVLFVVLLLSPVATLIGAHLSNPSAEAFTSANRRVRNVVLITVDTLRRDVLSCYGGRVDTPNLDRLAADGILFTNAFSNAPWTLPAVTSIMTGLSPFVHRVTRLESKLSDTVPTLAEHMQEARYYTGAVVGNSVLAPQRNLSKGFLDFYLSTHATVHRSFGETVLLELFPTKFGTRATTDDLTEAAIGWLRSRKDMDFMLWLHYLDPHLPYAPPAEYVPGGKPPRNLGKAFASSSNNRVVLDLVATEEQREWVEALYAAEVKYIDANIGRLVDELNRLGLYDSSLIILTSDHGEEFWEHGGYEHGHSLYDELIRMPLIVKLPGSKPVATVDAFVPTESVTPTIMDLCGVDYDREHLSSSSLRPLWEPEAGAFDEKPVVSTGLLFYQQKESVVFDGLKYIRSLVTKREELYDLATDPKEQQSIAASAPDQVELARDLIARQRQVAEKLREYYRVTADEIQFDEKTKKRLRALGYL